MKTKNIPRLDAIALDYLRYGTTSTTLKSVGKKWGITGCRVRQIVQGFLRRKRMEDFALSHQKRMAKIGARFPVK